MATNVGIEEAAPRRASSSTLQEQAKRHLWMHFTRMGAYADHDVPVIVRGEGCYVWDENGNRYLDGLSALFCVNAGPRPRGAGRGGRAPGARSWASTSTGATPTRPPSSWPHGSPSLAPGDLNRVFFTSGGSEAVESAWKLARNYHHLNGEGKRTKIIARDLAYHGTTLGALAATGLTELRAQFEPLTPGGLPRAEHEQLPLARGPRPAVGRGRDRGAHPLRGARDGRRGDPRAGAERGRLLRPAGGLLPARARDLRPPRRAASSPTR